MNCILFLHARTDSVKCHVPLASSQQDIGQFPESVSLSSLYFYSKCGEVQCSIHRSKNSVHGDQQIGSHQPEEINLILIHLHVRDYVSYLLLVSTCLKNEVKTIFFYLCTSNQCVRCSESLREQSFSMMVSLYCHMCDILFPI